MTTTDSIGDQEEIQPTEPAEPTAATGVGKVVESVVESVVEAEQKVEAVVVDAELAVETVVDKGAARHWSVADSIRVTIALLTLLITAMAASRGVSAPEARTFELVNSAPAALYPAIWPVMQLGNVWVAIVVAGGMGLLVRKPKASVILAAAPFAAWIIAKVVKDIVQRGRPQAMGLSLEPGRGPSESGFGFISGHTTVAFAVAGALIPHLRRPWNYVVFALATVVGVARIYVGAHLPLDVIGGAATGLIIGEIARLVETRPSFRRR